MAVLTGMTNNWLPDGGHKGDSEGGCSRITFIYVPDHDVVAINETADLLATPTLCHSLDGYSYVNTNTNPSRGTLTTGHHTWTLLV